MDETTLENHQQIITNNNLNIYQMYFHFYVSKKHLKEDRFWVFNCDNESPLEFLDVIKFKI
jgi:hypothetical protein